MWIAERTRASTQRVGAERGTVTIGGGAAGVLSRGEAREVATAAPGGYAWRPVRGEQVLLVRGGEDGDACWVVGSLGGAAKQETLADGEVCLFSGGGASITLRKDGRVEITGTVYVNGSPLAAGEEAETDGA